MEPLSIFGGFVQKVLVSCFSDPLFKKRRNNQMAAVMLQVIPSVYLEILQRTAFLFLQTHMKNFCE